MLSVTRFGHLVFNHHTHVNEPTDSEIDYERTGDCQTEIMRQAFQVQILKYIVCFGAICSILPDNGIIWRLVCPVEVFDQMYYNRNPIT